MTEHIRVSGLGVDLGGRTVLDCVDLAVEPGEAVAVVGPSGAGKTTLLRALLGLQPVDRGEILVGGRPAASMGGRARAAQLAWLPQMGATNEAIGVLDLVCAARFRFDEGRAQAERAALDALVACGVEDLAHKPITALSGGERQRVAIAALMAQHARALLLDEPSNHLDIRRQRELYELLGQQWRAGLALVMITHDVNLLAALGTPEACRRVRVVGLKQGRIQFETALTDPRLAGELSALYDLSMRAHPVGDRIMILPGGGA